MNDQTHGTLLTFGLLGVALIGGLYMAFGKSPTVSPICPVVSSATPVAAPPKEAVPAAAAILRSEHFYRHISSDFDVTKISCDPGPVNPDWICWAMVDGNFVVAHCNNYTCYPEGNYVQVQR